MRILDVVIAGVVGLCVALAMKSSDNRSAPVVYHQSWGAVVENTNQGSRESINGAAFESPVGVQWGLHELYRHKDIDNPEMFLAWDNAYRSFRESGVYDSSFTYKDNVVYVDLVSDLHNAEYDGEFIHIDGVVSPSGLVVQIGNDYEFVVTKYQSASVRECKVLLRPFEVHVIGGVDGLLQKFKSSGYELSFDGEFALSATDLPTCDTSNTDGYVLDVGYDYVVRRVSDGLEVAYGCR